MFDAALKSNKNRYKNIFIKMINYTIFIEKKEKKGKTLILILAIMQSHNATIYGIERR